MPSKRVSLKGQGAELFFGDYAPTVHDAHDAAPGVAPVSRAVPPPASMPPDPAPPAPPDPARESPTPPPGQAPQQTDPGPITTPVAQADAIEAIRKTVKPLGREVAFTRLTAEEKTGLADIVDAQRRQGTKTTENEITRIAIASLVRDYQAHGARSVLAQVLTALRA